MPLKVGVKTPTELSPNPVNDGKMKIFLLTSFLI